MKAKVDIKNTEQKGVSVKDGIPLSVLKLVLSQIRFSTLVEAVSTTVQEEGGKLIESITFSLPVGEADELKKLIKKCGGKENLIKRLLCLDVVHK